jgi:hypothetical protein
MFNALSILFKGNKINWKITLRTQLKNVNMQNLESIQSYFIRVSHIKEKIEVIRDSVKEVELMMTTLNGMSRSRESFI